jgi:hypothetical protein
LRLVDCLSSQSTPSKAASAAADTVLMGPGQNHELAQCETVARFEALWDSVTHHRATAKCSTTRPSKHNALVPRRVASDRVASRRIESRYVERSGLE